MELKEMVKNFYETGLSRIQRNEPIGCLVLSFKSDDAIKEVEDAFSEFIPGLINYKNTLFAVFDEPIKASRHGQDVNNIIKQFNKSLLDEDYKSEWLVKYGNKFNFGVKTVSVEDVDLKNGSVINFIDSFIEDEKLSAAKKYLRNTEIKKAINCDQDEFVCNLSDTLLVNWDGFDQINEIKDSKALIKNMITAMDKEIKGDHLLDGKGDLSLYLLICDKIKAMAKKGQKSPSGANISGLGTVEWLNLIDETGVEQAIIKAKHAVLPILREKDLFLRNEPYAPRTSLIDCFGKIGHAHKSMRAAYINEISIAKNIDPIEALAASIAENYVSVMSEKKKEVFINGLKNLSTKLDKVSFYDAVPLLLEKAKETKMDAFSRDAELER